MSDPPVVEVIVPPPVVASVAVTVPQGGGGGSSFPPAPADGGIYGWNGQSLSWTPVLPLYGDTMTGPVGFPGGTAIFNRDTNGLVQWQLNLGDPIGDGYFHTQLTYLDHASHNWFTPFDSYFDPAQQKTITTFQGVVTLGQDPVNPLDAVTLQYLEAHAGSSGPAPPTLAGTGYTGGWTTNPAGAQATFADSPKGIVLHSLDQGHDNINALCKPVPAAPWTITARIVMTQIWGAGDSWAGIVLRSTSGAYAGQLIAHGPVAGQNPLSGGLAVPAVFCLIFNDPLTFSNVAWGSAYTYSPDIWVRVKNDGANWTWLISQDGENFIATGPSQAVQSQFTQVGLFISAHGSEAYALIKEYSETSP